MLLRTLLLINLAKMMPVRAPDMSPSASTGVQPLDSRISRTKTHTFMSHFMTITGLQRK